MPTEKKFTLDPALIVAGDANELLPVAAEVNVSGVPKTICVLASEPFSARGLDLGLDVAGGHLFNPTGAAPDQVALYGCDVEHGARAIIEVAARTVTIANNGEYVWISYVFGSGEAFWQPFSGAGGESPSTTKPKSDRSTLRVWKYRFALSLEGVASIYPTAGIGHIGNIIVPGAFG